MKFFIKILFICIIAAAGYGYFLKSGLNGQKLFKILDSKIVAHTLNSERASALLAEIEARTGICSATGFFLAGDEGDLRPVNSLLHFPFYIPIRSTEFESGKLNCKSSDGRYVKFLAFNGWKIVVERMIGGPILLDVLDASFFLVEGTNIRFIWRSAFGDVEITSTGDAKLSIRKRSYQGGNDFMLLAETGSVKAFRRKDYQHAPQVNILELVTTRDSSIEWETPANKISSSKSAKVLPSGFYAK